MKRKIFLRAILLGLFISCEEGEIAPDEDDKITPNAKACFDYSPETEIKAGDEITFTNCSENATTYAWDFGDGDISTEKNPAHAYDTTGEYTVMLIASDGAGSADTTRLKVIVESVGSTVVTVSPGTFEIGDHIYTANHGYIEFADDELEVLLLDTDYNSYESDEEKVNGVFLDIENTGSMEGTYSSQDLSVYVAYIENDNTQKEIEGDEEENALTSETSIEIKKTGDEYEINYTLVFSDGQKVTGKYKGSLQEVSGGYIVENKIEVGAPFFTINVGDGYNTIYRVAWTGDKLWAITGLDGNSGTPQKLLDIDPSDGSIIQSKTPQKPMWSLDYANGKLWDIQTFNAGDEPKKAEQYDPTSGDYVGSWNYDGQYELYYYLTYDGANYRGYTNYNCDGYNCQSLVTYDEAGNVVSANDNFQFEDLVFGGGYFWASTGRGIILKLDKDYNVAATYHISDSDKFGEAQSANEITMHLEYIDSNLWIIDRSNNFYKTNIQ